mmetsp:Transcript_38982/g.110406  ORF Transcript_38982/g.110406 Transcript_38982/m.110406 type:complete len:271 (-) Transcript_38982:998-1810(-)
MVDITEIVEVVAEVEEPVAEANHPDSDNEEFFDAHSDCGCEGEEAEGSGHQAEGEGDVLGDDSAYVLVENDASDTIGSPTILDAQPVSVPQGGSEEHASMAASAPLQGGGYSETIIMANSTVEEVKEEEETITVVNAMEGEEEEEEEELEAAERQLEPEPEPESQSLPSEDVEANTAGLEEQRDGAPEESTEEPAVELPVLSEEEQEVCQTGRHQRLAGRKALPGRLLEATRVRFAALPQAAVSWALPCLCALQLVSHLVCWPAANVAHS